MTRTTKAQLDELMAVLNRRLGRPIDWGKPGNLHLQEAYGQGPRMYENVGLDRGEREVGPRLSRGPMADRIRAMLDGIDLAEQNIRLADPSWVSLPHWGDARLAAKHRPVKVPCHYDHPIEGHCLLEAYHPLPHLFREKPQCWLNLNGWGEAGYMDGGREQAEECRKLRGGDTCLVHSEAPGWDGAGASVEAQRG